jgi:hypothetical protein
VVQPVRPPVLRSAPWPASPVVRQQEQEQEQEQVPLRLQAL